MKNIWSSSYNCIGCRCPGVGSEGLHQCLWEEARGCPVVDTLQPFHNRSTAEPLSHVWGTSVKTYLRNGREHQKRSDQQRKMRRKRCSMLEQVCCQRNSRLRRTHKPQQRKNKTRSSIKTATSWLEPPAPLFASLKGLSVPHNGNKQGGELSGVKLSLGNEEGWFSPSVLMFAFFCLPVIEYLC